MKIPRKLTLRRRKLGKERAVGLAHPDGLIEIDSRERGRELLDTTLHEALHVVFGDLEEEEVVQIAGVLTDLLWNDHWRRVEN
jgi:hypothetical protein